ncbi:TolC family outer membrane protein [Pseudaeromonas sp. ZJS20]|uniref:TolC family outer membrane protein n=1 Tax=Pseudaeromonas aegiceratis TaxID=3153928 RepID=UPI00390C5FBE
MKKTHLAALMSAALVLPAASWAQSLEQSVAEALLTHPQIQEAYHLYQSRQYQIDEAKAGYLPKLDAIAGIGPERTNNSTTRSGASDVDKNQTRKEATVSLTQMLFDGFDTSSNVNRTEAEAEAQKYALFSTAENTALRVSEVYLNVLRQQEIFELSKKNLQVHEEILADIAKRTDSGLGSTADLSQIQGRVARAYANLAAAENNLRDAQSEYMRVVNAEPMDMVQPVPDADMLPANLDDALKVATEQHPTLLSSQQDIEAARYQHEGAKANFYPRVSVEASQSWYEDADGIKGSSEEGRAMLMVRYNLFNGGADTARSRSTSALQSQAKDIHLNAYRQVEEGTRLAWAARDSLLQQKEFFRKHVDSSYDTVQAYKKQFTLGKRTLLDVLNTENELFEARRSYINADYDELYAEYRIMNATGRLLDSLRVTKPEQWK